MAARAAPVPLPFAASEQCEGLSGPALAGVAALDEQFAIFAAAVSLYLVWPLMLQCGMRGVPALPHAMKIGVRRVAGSAMNEHF